MSNTRPPTALRRRRLNLTLPAETADRLEGLRKAYGYRQTSQTVARLINDGWIEIWDLPVRAGHSPIPASDGGPGDPP